MAAETNLTPPSQFDFEKFWASFGMRFPEQQGNSPTSTPVAPYTTNDVTHPRCERGIDPEEGGVA